MYNSTIKWLLKTKVILIRHGIKNNDIFLYVYFRVKLIYRKELIWAFEGDMYINVYKNVNKHL